MASDSTNILRDLVAEEVVGFQVDLRNRIWVCVDGQCVLRVKGAKTVEITDMRSPEVQDETPENERVAG